MPHTCHTLPRVSMYPKNTLSCYVRPFQTFFPCFAAAFVLLQIHAGVQNRVIGLPKYGSETRVFPMAVLTSPNGNRHRRQKKKLTCELAHTSEDLGPYMRPIHDEDPCTAFNQK